MRVRIGMAVVAAAIGAAFLGAAAAAEAGRGFELSVIIDGRPAPEYSFGGRLYVEALKRREFALRLHNPTGERVAVALSVDGRNVIDAKRTSAGRAAKWVLGPGETADIPGWQVTGENARRFFFTDIPRSYSAWLGDTSNTGVIEAVYFRERSRPPEITRREAEAPRSGNSRAEPDRIEGGVEGGVPGGIAGGVGEPPRERSDSEKKSAVRPAPSPQADELAATGIGEKTDFSVRWVRFDEDPSPVARISVRYEYRAELVRLGVLPRAGEGSWRDRSRGFEPDYAPDPYRTNRRER